MSRNKLEGASIQARRDGGITGPNSLATFVSSTSDTLSIPIQPAEVIDIIYNKSHPDFQNINDIGKVKVRFLYDKKTKDESTLSWASPLNLNFVQYPLKGEVIYVLTFLGTFFYFTNLNYSGNVNNNSAKNISSSRTKEQDTDYQTTENTGISNKSSEREDLGDTFVNNSKKIKPIQPYEGDIIIQGRFGNTIRIGSEADTNLPVIKLTVGQSTDNNNLELDEPYDEDINDNKSCIWITSDELVPFNPITEGKSYYLKSAKSKPNRYEGNEVFINSDRLIFNAKKEEILLFSNKGISLNTNSYIAIDSSDDIGITTLSKLNIEAKYGTYFDSKEIILGKSATEPLVLGNKLMQLLNDLLTELANETHPTGTGPSGPPINAAKYKIIQNKLRTIKSSKNKTL